MNKIFIKNNHSKNSKKEYKKKNKKFEGNLFLFYSSEKIKLNEMNVSNNLALSASIINLY